jgi:hypothetical protein
MYEPNHPRPHEPPPRAFYPFALFDGREKPTEYVRSFGAPFVRTPSGWRAVPGADVAGAVELED